MKIRVINRIASVKESGDMVYAHFELDNGTVVCEISADEYKLIPLSSLMLWNKVQQVNPTIPLDEHEPEAEWVDIVEIIEKAV